METKVVQVAIEHPAEKLFGFDPGSTVVDQVTVIPEETVEHVLYDEKDNEIDGQYQQVFNAAYGAFEAQRMATEGMNPQFIPRHLEIAAQFLNTALAAAKEKSSLKQSKDKLHKLSNSGGGGNVTNNNIIMGRNEMLRMLMNQANQDANIIDADE